MAKFELYKDKAGEFRFRYKASNGEIMFGSEGYAAKTSAVDAIESIKKNVAGATVDDLTVAAAAKPAKAKAPAKPAAAKPAAAKPEAVTPAAAPAPAKAEAPAAAKPAKPKAAPKAKAP